MSRDAMRVNVEREVIDAAMEQLNPTPRLKAALQRWATRARIKPLWGICGGCGERQGVGRDGTMRAHRDPDARRAARKGYYCPGVACYPQAFLGEQRNA